MQFKFFQTYLNNIKKMIEFLKVQKKKAIVTISTQELRELNLCTNQPDLFDKNERITISTQELRELNSDLNYNDLFDLLQSKNLTTEQINLIHQNLINQNNLSNFDVLSLTLNVLIAITAVSLTVFFFYKFFNSNNETNITKYDVEINNNLISNLDQKTIIQNDFSSLTDLSQKIDLDLIILALEKKIPVELISNNGIATNDISNEVFSTKMQELIENFKIKLTQINDPTQTLLIEFQNKLNVSKLNAFLNNNNNSVITTTTTNNNIIELSPNQIELVNEKFVELMQLKPHLKFDELSSQRYVQLVNYAFDVSKQNIEFFKKYVFNRKLYDHLVDSTFAGRNDKILKLTSQHAEFQKFWIESTNPDEQAYILQQFFEVCLGQLFAG